MNFIERLQEWWLDIKWCAIKRMIDAKIGANDFAYARLHVDGRNDLICIYRERRSGHAWDAMVDCFNFHHVERQVYGTFVLMPLPLDQISVFTRNELENTRQAWQDTSGIRAREVISDALDRIEQADEEAWLPVLTDKDGIVWALNRRSNIRRTPRETTFVVDMLDPELRRHPNRRHAPACFHLERLHTYPGTWHEALGDFEYPDRKPESELVIQVDVTRVDGIHSDIVVVTPIAGSRLQDVHRYRVQVRMNQKIPRDKCIDAEWVDNEILELIRKDLGREFMVTRPYASNGNYHIDENL